jgi:uncharacterized membrane protein YfcA
MDTTFIYTIYIFIGLFAGIIGGLLGIGGGAITVPCFFIIFKWLGFPHAYLMPLAVGTSLAAMIFTSFSACWSHQHKKVVEWKIFNKMAPGLFIGAIMGSLVTVWLPENILEIFFGIFLCALSTLFFRMNLPLFSISKIDSSLLIRTTSFFIGTLSNIFGIGGGILTIPLLLSIKVPDLNAIGTSSAITLLVSTLGTLSYIFFGWNHNFGSQNIGYVNIPAFLIVGMTTFFTAPIGVKLSHELSPKKMRKIFAIILILSGITFISLNLLYPS